MAASGDWQTQSDIPHVANMPLHYSSAKYAASLRVGGPILGRRYAGLLYSTYGQGTVPEGDS